MAPAKMKAIKIIEGNKAELQEVSVPKLRDDYMLCKVNCIALNPTDWKHIDFVGKPGSTVGCDFSGVVEEVGSKVEGWKKGDRIAGMTHGGNQSNTEDGSFGEYCVAKGGLGLKIPDSMSDEDAATLGVGVITCGQALYQSLGLPLPGQGKYGGYVLIYGGSTASGTLAIQYAVLSGAKVITTASERNWPMLKKLGAEATFDYKDPDCAKKIREYTNDSLTLAMDCIAEGDSPKICEESISSKGGAISYLLSAEHTRTDVENKHTFGYTIFGEDFEKRGKQFKGNLEDYEFSKKFWVITKGLLEEGKLKTHPARVEKGGLEGAFDGFQQFRDGKISGVKLVYRVGETPK